VKVIRSKGYQNQLTAMGTIVETNTLKEALSLIEDAYAELEPDCERVYVTVNIDIKKDGDDRIHTKVQSVESKISSSK
jgi:uncharacterized protein YqgV (UPF0045/DUF77 family)